MPATTIPTIDGPTFAARIGRDLPTGWCSEDAKQPGGNVYAMLLAAGQQAAQIVTELQYALGATRMRTATAPELDQASVDLLGDTLPRPLGMSDSAFAALILANLFKSAASRPVVSHAILLAAGVQPRMIEPWNVGDTGALGVSYMDVDSAAVPGRIGGPELRYQGLIETLAPTEGEAALETMITSIHAEGTVIYVRYVATPS